MAHPGFEQIFYFIDWNRDGKISEAEYIAFKDQLKLYSKEGAQSEEKTALKPSANDSQSGSHIEKMEATFRKRNWIGHVKFGRRSIKIRIIFGNTKNSHIQIGSVLTAMVMMA